MSLLRLIKKHSLFFASILVLFPLFLILSSYYFQRLGAFGCFDDCFNIVGGYFVLKGKIIYSEFFFNHMPLMPYLSAIIQKITSPDSIYHLILYHKLFLLSFSVLSWMFLVYRFKWIGLFFVLFYEPFKIYLFGDRFLAEGIIIYPLVYMVGLVWLKFHNKYLYKWDYFIAAIASWFVIFSREPYIPLALFLFFLILWGKKEVKIKSLSLILFFVLSLVIILVHPINDLIFNIYTVNKIQVSSELASHGTNNKAFVKIFLYPLLIFFTGEVNLMRFILASLNIVFLLLLVLLTVKNKLLGFIIILILGLANLRYVDPGSIFYGAYHMLVWYGLFVMLLSLMFFYSKNKVLKKILAIFLSVIFLIGIFSPQYILWARVDTVREFNDGYANYEINGKIIKTLANKNSTLFVDGGDELIHWIADLNSPYKYSWYTSSMPYHRLYSEARLKMFGENPPDFYFGNCDSRFGYYLPDFVKNDYINLKNKARPSCIFINKNLISEVSKDAWGKAKDLGFTLE